LFAQLTNLKARIFTNPVDYSSTFAISSASTDETHRFVYRWEIYILILPRLPIFSRVRDLPQESKLPFNARELMLTPVTTISRYPPFIGEKRTQVVEVVQCSVEIPSHTSECESKDTGDIGPNPSRSLCFFQLCVSILDKISGCYQTFSFAATRDLSDSWLHGICPTGRMQILVLKST
jgi:hypothetical protein